MNTYIHENCGGMVTDPFTNPVCSECGVEGRASIKAIAGRKFEVHFLTPDEIQADDVLNETVKQNLSSVDKSRKAMKNKP